MSEEAGLKQKSEEEEIRRLIERRIGAIRVRNVDGATEVESPDIVLFDVVNPLQFTGITEARQRTAEWFASFDRPIGYEVRDLVVAAGDDVAFSYGLYHVDTFTRDGRRLDMWWRGTGCYRKIDGSWKVVHEHNSVPFDTANGMASLGLKP